MALASERRTFDIARDHFPVASRHAKMVIDRIRSVRSLPADAQILDIGSAQGLFLIACAKLGYRAFGVEPDATAREVGAQVAAEYGVDVTIVEGVAEALPVESNSFDVVHAKSVVEHVVDVEAVFSEVYRVLRPGGVFWFNTASSMCPQQCEIRGFPAFGWYPNSLKRRVMDWAIAHRPELIGHTSRPAYQWFTPGKARRMLRAAGFTMVYDRWDLRGGNEGGRAYRAMLGFVRMNAATKTMADILVAGCSYAAIK
ncbi:MAG: class I SAM-dependent methyltransferase [Candidatus Baltobacteraceae bacterium]